MKTVLIDTNTILRFLIADVPSQFKLAKKTFQQIEEGKLQGKISLLVINELVWILENYYKLKRSTYLPHLLKLLLLKKIKIIEVNKHLLIKVLKKMTTHQLDFTDLYLAEIKNNDELFTFDKQLARFTR